MTIKVSVLNEYAVVPTRKHSNDAGMDLYYNGDDFNLSPNKTMILHTGVKVKIPSGYFGFVADKSRNEFDILGRIVDESYQGEILVKVINTTKDPIGFRDGQAIAQLILIPCLTDSIEEVPLEDLYDSVTSRGATGGVVFQLHPNTDVTVSV